MKLHFKFILIVILLLSYDIYATEKWQKEGDYLTYRKNLDSFAGDACHKKYLILPNIIQGCQELYADSNLIASNGDCKFNSVGHYYSPLIVECSRLNKSSEIRWIAKSFIDEFARISSEPSLSSSKPINSILTGILNVFVSGALAILAMFIMAIFWKKVPVLEGLSLSLASLSWSIYHALIVSSSIGIDLSMFITHKISDLALIFGTFFYMIVLFYERIIHKKIILLYAPFIGISFSMALLATDGNEIQNATNIAFIPTILMSFYIIIHSIIIYRNEKNLLGTLKLISVSSFFLGMSNDILHTSGVINSVFLFWFGSLGGILFLVLLLNEKINIIYDERNELLNSLEIKVRDRTEKISKLYDNLLRQEKMATLGLIAAGVAHQLGNTINSISSCILGLKRAKKANKISDEILDITISVTQKAVSVSKEIIRGLDNASKTNLIDENFNLSDLVNTAIILSKGKMFEKVKANNLVSEEITVYGKKNSLLQAVVNIILNAVDALEGERHGVINIESFAEVGKIRLCISDNGIGIPEQLHKTLFDPFCTNKNSHDGSGMGLYVAKKSIEENNGRIEFKTGSDGTVFSIFLNTRRAHV